MTSATKFRMTCRCGCGKEFKKITTNRKYLDLPDGSEELAKLMSKIKCPDCKAADSDRRFRVGDGEVRDDDLVAAAPILAVENYTCESCGKNNRFYKEKEDDKLGHCQHCGSQNVKYIGHTVAGITSQTSQNMIKALDYTAKATMDTYKMGDLNLNSNMKPGDNCAPKLPPAQQKMADNFFGGGGIPNSGAIAQKALAGAYRDNNNPIANLHRSKVAPKFDITNAPPVNVKKGASVPSYDKLIQRHN